MAESISISRAEGNTVPRHWSVARLLREKYPDVRLRAAFRSHPFLESVSLDQVFSTALSFDRFLSECRKIPQCGDTQIRRLRALLEENADPSPGAESGQSFPEKFQHVDETEPTISGSGAVQDPGSSIPISGQFYPDCISAFSAVYRRLFRLAHFDRFIYVPDTLPEIAKTAEVLRAEIGSEAELSGYYRSNSELFSALTSITQISGMILLDRSALAAVFGREGRYHALSASMLHEQRRRLFQMQEVLPEGVEFTVIDRAAHLFSDMAIVGDLLSWSMHGGYFVTRNPAMCDMLAARCSRAVGDAPELRDVLADFDI